MFNKDTMKATGMVDIIIRDADGRIKDERHVPNLVVDAGLDFIAGRMKGTGVDSGYTVPDEMSHMEVGTDNTAAGASDTTLGAAVGSSRTALTSATVTDNAIAYVCTFAAGTGTGALTEAGIFNAAAAGDMLCRTVFSVINKGASDSMTITWTITIS